MMKIIIYQTKNKITQQVMELSVCCKLYFMMILIHHVLMMIHNVMMIPHNVMMIFRYVMMILCHFHIFLLYDAGAD